MTLFIPGENDCVYCGEPQKERLEPEGEGEQKDEKCAICIENKAYGPRETRQKKAEEESYSRGRERFERGSRGGREIREGKNGQERVRKEKRKKTKATEMLTSF